MAPVCVSEKICTDDTKNMVEILLGEAESLEEVRIVEVAGGTTMKHPVRPRLVLSVVIIFGRRVERMWQNSVDEAGHVYVFVCLAVALGCAIGCAFGRFDINRRSGELYHFCLIHRIEEIRVLKRPTLDD